MRAPAHQLRAILDEAVRQLADGDAVEAERRAKAIIALVRAEHDLAELETAAAVDLEDDEESRRAELRRRLALLAEAEFSGAAPETLDRIALTGSAA